MDSSQHQPPTARAEATRVLHTPADLSRRITGLSQTSVYRALRGERVSLSVQRAVLVALREAAVELGFDPPTEVRFGWAPRTPKQNETASPGKASVPSSAHPVKEGLNA